MATISKTKYGKWRALVRVSGWPATSKNFRIKRDAETWARVTEDEMIRGVYAPRASSEKLSVHNALERYANEVTPTKSPTTQVSERQRAKHLQTVFGKYSLAVLNTDIICDYRDKRLKEGKSNNTVRLELALLGHLYTTAIKEWRIGVEVNPVHNVRKPSAGSGRNRRLIDNEEGRLLTACDEYSNPILGWVVRIALYTAMRNGEIFSLTEANVDLAKKVVTIHDTKNKDSRTIPLTKKAQAVFKEVLKNPYRSADTSLLFHGEPGRDGVRRAYAIEKCWRQALVKAEIEGFRFHDLRHEATSRFVEAGLSDQQVASITGHKSMQMLRRYTHLRNEDLVNLISDV